MNRSAFSLFGPAGAGKGTARLGLTLALNAVPFSTGEYVSSLQKAGRLTAEQISMLKSGILFPDEMMAELITNFVQSTTRDLVLDGYPRTIQQAHDLEAIFTRNAVTLKGVLYLSAPKDVLTERVLSRRVCVLCQYPASPTVESCNACGSLGFEKRDTDNVEAIERRLTDFYNFFGQIQEFYGDKIIEINANRPVEDVIRDVVTASLSRG